MGLFQDLDRLAAEESEIPENVPIVRVAEQVDNLLLANHQFRFLDPGYRVTDYAYFAIVVQISSSSGKRCTRARRSYPIFRNWVIAQADDAARNNREVNLLELGLPFGFDNKAVRDNKLARKDPKLAIQFAADPKTELTKCLDRGVAERPWEVQPPYTFLLLRNDGTVSDMSDEQLCTIPDSVRYINPSKATATAKRLPTRTAKKR
jgi:hypothetical protein